MAPPTVGTSLGQNPFKAQDTFTWEDLTRGLGSSAKQARYSWEVNGLPKSEEAHFFELGMTAFEDEEEFSIVLSMHLYPYDYLIFSETRSFQAAKVEDLTLPVMAYLEGLFGESLVKRVTRRYGGKILEWLESVEILHKQGVEE